VRDLVRDKKPDGTIPRLVLEEVEELVEGMGVVEHMLWEALGVMATLETWALEGESWESKSSQ